MKFKETRSDAKPILFLHGGPGMSSVAEEVLLSQLLMTKSKTLVFWNEPSKFRPDGFPFSTENAFANWVESAFQEVTKLAANGNKVQIIAHSFATQAAARIAERAPELLHSILSIAPCMDFFTTCKNILNLAQNDFKTTDPEKSVQMADLLQKTRTLFDPPMQEGAALAVQDPALFLNYWKNTGRMQEFFSILISRKIGLDSESFFHVIRDLAAHHQTWRPGQPIRVPTCGIFGKFDRVVTNEIEMKIFDQYFEKPRKIQFEHSAHFPHLEETEKFLELI